MPDLTGWSLADVMKLVNAVNLKFAFEGQGFVRSQNIEPGTVISKESNLQVELQRPIETIKSTEEKSKDSEDLE